MKKTKLDIIFENDDLVVINKPSGMLSIPDRFNHELPNAYHLLKEDYNKKLNTDFEEGNIEKEYLALCYSKPEIETGMIDVPIAHSGKLDGKMVVHPRGKESITKYKVLESWQKFSLLMVKPLTGRTHQIRVHLAYIHCPIVGERVYHEFVPLTISMLKPYAKIDPEMEERPLMNRVALHASKLSLELNGVEINVEAAFPKDMNASLNQIRKCLKHYSVQLG